MRKKRLVGYGLLLLWLAGCSILNSQPPTAAIPTGSKTPMVREATRPMGVTDSPKPAAATHTSTASVTPIPSATTTQTPLANNLQIKQLKWYETIPDGYQGDGAIVLYHEVERQVEFVDLTHSDKWQIKMQSTRRIQELGILSPDGKWIIRLKNPDVEAPEDKTYEVVSAQGELQTVFTLPWEWSLRDNWVNDHQILADRRVEENVLVYETMAIDALNGEKRNLPFDYPDIYNLNTMQDHDYNIYDPTLQYVIYPAFLMDAPPGIVLRDVKKQHNILTFESYDGEPRWSPDGKMFALGSNARVFGGFLDGTIKNLDHVERNESLKFIPVYDRIRWSPDGKKIAYSMLVDSGNEAYKICLGVLDVGKEAVTSYCVSGHDVHGPGFYEIVWGFDNHKLLVEGNISHNNSIEGYTLLIDLEKEIAIDLGQRVSPFLFPFYLACGVDEMMKKPCSRTGNKTVVSGDQSFGEVMTLYLFACL